MKSSELSKLPLGIKDPYDDQLTIVKEDLFVGK